MNRIEQVKERVRTYHYHNETDDAGDDIFYLLSKLEMAENSLERMSKGNFSAPMEYTQVEAYQKYAESVLERLRQSD